MENKSLKIGILGLGLIGGSILKALSSLKKYYLIAVSSHSSKKAAEFANVSGDDINLLKDSDVIFVCSKMSETEKYLSELENIVSKKTIVADVCSIKGFIKGNYKFNYIPSHPMAGTEFTGFDYSFKELFNGAKWILGKNEPVLSSLIEEMGAIPLILANETHDNLTAQISHLPMLLSFALFDSVEESAKKIASSGFKDTTRLAMTNPDMAFDMLNFNRENILKAYEKVLNSFDKMKNMSEEEFKNFVIDIAKKRSAMYDSDGKNIL